jgi:hypothetical protein
MNCPSNRRCRICQFVLLFAVVATSPVAFADIILETADPFGSPFGLWGPDVCLDQSVGLRFTPDGHYKLDRVSLWFMSNDFSGKTHPLVEVSVRTDTTAEGSSVPSDEILEFWTFNVSAVGWDPVLEVLDSTVQPLLTEGVNYWIVAESMAPCGLDGVWNFASVGTGFMAFSFGFEEAWQPGGSGAVAATIIEGTPLACVCPWDCSGDNDGTVGIADLLALLAQWGGPGSCDFDSGNVGVADLLKLLATWGDCDCP